MASIDLATALNMFKSGVQEFQLQRAIGNANEQVQQLRASDMDEQQKRAQLQAVSNDLVTRMAQFGAPATTIQQVAGAIGPKQINSPEQAIFEGQMTGNQELADAGIKAQQTLAAPHMAAQQAQFKQQQQLQDRLFSQQTALEAMKERAKAGQAQQQQQKPQQGDTEFKTNVQVAMNEATKLNNLVGEYGNTEYWNSDASAKLKSAQYQLAINYAKIVDPSSVAREGEVEAAKKYMIPMGPGVRNSETVAAIKEYKAKIGEYIKARAAAKQNPMSGPVSTEQAPDWAAFQVKSKE